jgi:hypothetical protein
VRTIITAFVMKGAGVLKLNLFACCCIPLPFVVELNYLLTFAPNIINLLDSLVFQLCIKIVQAGLVLCFFFYYYYFVFTRLENLHHFSHLCSNFRFNVMWNWRYGIIFSVTQFGIDDLWHHLSCVGEQQKVTSLSRNQSRIWTDYVGDIITQLT